MPSPLRILVIGGGAAGFFGAVRAASLRPDAQVTLLERGKTCLNKVLISGGGRCNLTHACFDPKTLVRAYPRGGRELLGPFHRFGPADTAAWFEAQGVAVKTEADGRMFPQSDRSESVADALMLAAQAAGVQVRTQMPVSGIQPAPAGGWLVTAGRETLEADRLLIAAGSSERIWAQLAALGHRIELPVPSLFTFNIRDPRIEGLAGISAAAARASLLACGIEAEGPLLITHWGLSGPAILKLSAWGARSLHALGYETEVRISWTSVQADAVQADLAALRRTEARRLLRSCPLHGLPLRLWERLAEAAGIPADRRCADLGKQEAGALAAQLTAASFPVQGKSTFKEEFVTAGGVALEEVDFRRFGSRLHPGLFLAGEILDIDAITGGYNFQAAWTGGWIAGEAMAE
ncbi:MAG: NAD(P)/FAD-dependent oxidoreductase [Bacteroidia bacterium]|nr:NAD(P)/FAD-dependent oxidoreductase [Bacteroidia bacterium]